MGFAVIFSMLVFAGLFIVLPLFVGGRLDDVSILPFHLSEGIVRLALFVGYLVAISFIPDIRRVFQYHGAEHKTIAAYENDVELTPESADQFTTAHVRCGTNFLLTVMVVAIFVYSFIPTPNIFVIIASRVVLIPVIAGLSYEVIRLAAKNMQRRWVRVLMKPGLWLQKLTTREPDLEQLEVAIASMRAVLTAEQMAEVEARPRARARFLHSAPRTRLVSPPRAYRSSGRKVRWGVQRGYDGAGPDAVSVGRLRPASLFFRSGCRSPSLRCPRSESRPTATGRSPFDK